MIKIAEFNKADNLIKDGNIRTFNGFLCDVSRYVSDRYELDVNLRKTYSGFSIGCLVIHSHIGVSVYTKYWKYSAEEFEIASKVFDVITKISSDIRDEIQEFKIPPANFGNMFRKRMKNIDALHKESSGIPCINNSITLDYEEDCRETIYGKRYPEPDTNNMKSIFKHPQPDVKQIKTENSGRNKITKYYWK